MNTVIIKMGDCFEIENMNSLFETIRYAQISYGNCKDIQKANIIQYKEKVNNMPHFANFE